MNFKDAVVTCFKKYATLQGRASRSEYWYWVLFCMLCSIFFRTLKLDTLDLVFALITLPPFVGVAARRLHDVNRSGWWQLIPLTIIGIIPFVYWMCKEPVNDGNRFGPAPLS